MTGKLTDLGFEEGTIFEVIVSTYNPDGSANAAPMGATMHKPQTLELKLFNTSQTSKNLMANRCAVINLTCNIDLFYRTTFKEANQDGKLPQEWFTKAQAVNAPKLRSADATVEVAVTEFAPIGSEKTKALCKVAQIDAEKRYPMVYCRAMAATLEAIIHATRVKAFAQDKGKQQQLNQPLTLIAGCRDVVERTAPHSQYSAVMTDLEKRILVWRSKP